MLMNITRTGVAATRSARGGVAAFSLVTASLGAFSRGRVHTGR
jgi:hypothetical protein